ncbi:MAG: hypothetical protein ABL925_14445 [Methylococcales bacterium]
MNTMNLPGFSGEVSIYERRNIYRTALIVADNPAVLTIMPQRLGYTCAGKYCDCNGTLDCIDMINGKCGGWTRCTVVNGWLQCICEPRFAVLGL